MLTCFLELILLLIDLLDLAVQLVDLFPPSVLFLYEVVAVAIYERVSHGRSQVFDLLAEQGPFLVQFSDPRAELFDDRPGIVRTLLELLLPRKSTSVLEIDLLRVSQVPQDGRLSLEDPDRA